MDLLTAIAQRRGTRPHLCDAAAVHTHGATTAAAVVDGIGNTPTVAETARLLAEVIARIAAHRRDGLAALLTARDLLGEDTPNAVAVVAVARRGRATRVHWVGDAAAYGWTGTRLHRYTTPHTVGQQLRTNGAPWEIASDHDNWVRTTLAAATVATVNDITIPSTELVLLVSDGAEQLLAAVVRDLVAQHTTDPHTLAEALVAAVPDDDTGYRDDATALILTHHNPKENPMPNRKKSGSSQTEASRAECRYQISQIEKAIADLDARPGLDPQAYRHTRLDLETELRIAKDNLRKLG